MSEDKDREFTPCLYLFPFILSRHPEINENADQTAERLDIDNYIDGRWKRGWGNVIAESASGGVCN